MQSDEEPKEAPKPKNVIEALLLVKRQIDALGVGKDKRVQDGPAKYAYRSVDDVINAIGPMLTNAGVITSISYHDVFAEDVSIVNQKGTRHAHRVKCLQRVKFSHSNSNGLITTLDTEAIGEGLDSGDKAANKAMSVAYKYALGLALPIPFVGRDDPDAEQPVLAGAAHGQKQEAPVAKVDLPTYMSRIAQCLDINLLRGIVGEGMRQAAASGDMDARTKIRDAGKLRADMLVEIAEGQSAEMDRTFKETVTEDGEVV